MYYDGNVVHLIEEYLQKYFHSTIGSISSLFSLSLKKIVKTNGIYNVLVGTTIDFSFYR